LDRKLLEEAIAYKDYPYMVVANYKSLYKMDVLTGDEVTQDLIERRKQKIQTAYEQKLVNDETYRQEKLYVEFLRVFADMKQNLNAYRLNYRNNSPEVNAKNLFGIIQEYKRLRGTHDTREKAFANNSTYQNIFQPEYRAILNNADLYLEADHNLKNGKLLVNTLRDLENDPKAWSTPEKREEALTRLYAVELPKPEFLSASVEGEAIVRLIRKLEDQQYNEVFSKEVRQLGTTEATEETLPRRNTLLDKSNNTKCQNCREKVREAVTDYDKRYESYLLREALHQKEALNKEAEELVLRYSKWQLCYQGNLQALAVASTDNSTNLYYARIIEKNEALASGLKKLDALTKQEPETIRLQKVQERSRQLQEIMKEVKDNYNLLCEQDKWLCECELAR
jgi:hypothetical protein